jgi:hypothetical protein
MLKLQLKIKILKGALWHYISCVLLCQNILVMSSCADVVLRSC